MSEITTNLRFEISFDQTLASWIWKSNYRVGFLNQNVESLRFLKSEVGYSIFVSKSLTFFKSRNSNNFAVECFKIIFFLVKVIRNLIVKIFFQKKRTPNFGKTSRSWWKKYFSTQKALILPESTFKVLETTSYAVTAGSFYGVSFSYSFFVIFVNNFILSNIV